MKNKSKNKLDEKVSSGQFILSEQAVQAKPPIDKKKLIAAEKEKNKADKKAKKGKCHIVTCSHSIVIRFSLA